VRSGPPHSHGQNGGVAQAIESLEKIRAIEVMTDRSSSRAATYVLLCYTPQVAGYKRVQTPQIADIPPHTPQIAEVEPVPPEVVPDPPPPVREAVATDITPINHLAGLKILLAALKIKANYDLPFYWWRAEQTCSMRGLCSYTRLTV